MFWIAMSAPTAVSLLSKVAPRLAQIAAGAAGTLILADVLVEAGQHIHLRILEHRAKVARIRALSDASTPPNVVPLHKKD
jgi:hypothetical protein